jgi:hypothetical protein
MRWRGDDFKPIQAPFRLTAKAACDYTAYDIVEELAWLRFVPPRGDFEARTATSSRTPTRG